MKYAGPSIVTPRQVGATAVIIDNKTIYNVTIDKTRSTHTGAIEYRTSQFPNRWFVSTDLYNDSTAAKAAMTII